MNTPHFYRWLFLFSILLFVAQLTIPTLSADQPLRPEIADQTFSTEDLVAENWVESDLFGERSVVYTSSILEAPVSFNALFSEWVVAEGVSFELEIRTGVNGRWQKWQPIHESADWQLETDQFQSGEMLLVPDSDRLHQQYQFKLYFKNEAESKKGLKEIKFIFMNTTEGPTTEQMRKIQTVGKPPVIPRSEWCTYADCSCTTNCDPCINENPLAYKPVTHVVIHHTVSSNSSSNWAAVVRAIYSYHTYPTHCWGDVGYNYLIDMNGVIYEGHRGGDDVVGTHASAANSGSMGVALMGTFTSPAEYSVGIAPPQAMLDGLVDLVSWKVDQKGIDPYSSSRMPYTVWGLPHIMGHRDVYGGTNTTCPGDQAHSLIPWVRSQVANRIGFQNPYRYFDSWYQGTGEDNSYFHKSAANWYVAPKGCGFNRHAYYTWSTTDPNQAVNNATWDLLLNRAGNYEIEVYAPYCDTGRSETKAAMYTVNHDSGATELLVDQNAGAGLWSSLGTFHLDPTNSPSIYLTDLNLVDSGKGVWFDALRVRFLDPSLQNVAPGMEWHNSLGVDFSWSRENFATDPLSMTIEIASTSDFSPTLIAEPVTNTAANQWTYIFNSNDAAPLLYWRVQAVVADTLEIVTSSATQMQFDLESPTAEISSVLQNEDYSAFIISWFGADSLSGVSHYDVDVRAANELNWSRWVTGTTLTETSVIPMIANQPYWFRVQATDYAGNVTPISMTQPISSGIPLGPYVDLVADSWYFSDIVTLQWDARNMDGYRESLLEIGLDSNFTTLILTETITGTKNWIGLVPITDQPLYWRVSVTDEISQTAVSRVGQFYIDTVGPDINLIYFYQTMGGRFNELEWGAFDEGIGFSHYQFSWRVQGETVWQVWMADSGVNQGGLDSVNGIPEFKITAVDKGGNEQIMIVQNSILFPNQQLLPMMTVNK